MNMHLVRLFFNEVRGNDHLSFFGVMDRIADEIVQYLAEAYHIREHFFRDVLVDIGDQRYLFRIRQRLELVVYVPVQLVQVHDGIGKGQTGPFQFYSGRVYR